MLIGCAQGPSADHIHKACQVVKLKELIWMLQLFNWCAHSYMPMAERIAALTKVVFRYKVRFVGYQRANVIRFGWWKVHVLLSVDNCCGALCSICAGSVLCKRYRKGDDKDCNVN